MSRNKMVKFVHETTGLSYGECRRLLKECNWDVWKASGMETIADKILETIPDLTEIINNTLDAIVDAVHHLTSNVINNIDWQRLAELIIEANSNLEEKEDEDRVLLPDGQDTDSDSSGEGHRL